MICISLLNWLFSIVAAVVMSLTVLVQYKLLLKNKLYIMCMYVYNTYCSHVTLVAFSVLILVFYLKHCC